MVICYSIVISFAKAYMVSYPQHYLPVKCLLMREIFICQIYHYVSMLHLHFIWEFRTNYRSKPHKRLPKVNSFVLWHGTSSHIWWDSGSRWKSDGWYDVLHKAAGPLICDICLRRTGGKLMVFGMRPDAVTTPCNPVYNKPSKRVWIYMYVNVTWIFYCSIICLFCLLLQ